MSNRVSNFKAWAAELATDSSKIEEALIRSFNIGVNYANNTWWIEQERDLAEDWDEVTLEDLEAFDALMDTDYDD